MAVLARARIGISSALRAGEEPGESLKRYAEALGRAGAGSVYLPVAPSGVGMVYASELDGLVLSGGRDVEPSLYGGDAGRCDPKRDPERDRTEIALLIAAIAMNVPILCVCRGLQVANVALGGTLIEDLSSELGRDCGIEHQGLTASDSDYSHDVIVRPGTVLSKFMTQGRFAVNSCHHQAIRDLAPGLVAAAYSEDAVIEGAESIIPHQFLVGVQWHPESLGEQDLASAELFQAFVRAATARYAK
jgi:putative glutamine amidotransferase